MKIFVDDSGDFGWIPPGVSLFCALTVGDRVMDELTSKFTGWRRQSAKEEVSETKGKDLSPLQQASFVQSVILATPRVRVTLAGTKTTLFRRDMAEHFRDDAVGIFRAVAKRTEDNDKAELARFYKAMAKWVEKRSPENVLWVSSLAHVIPLALQHSILQFAQEEDDAEFENIEILIDRSFIIKNTHESYWGEWLRNVLLNESLKEPTLVIKEWSGRNHAFIRKYRRAGGILDLSDLFRNNMRFTDSRDVPGIQIVDICANIAFRRYAAKPTYRPYRLLRSRISGRRGVEMHTRILNESSLLHDAPENHVRMYSDDDLAAWAEAVRRERRL